MVLGNGCGRKDPAKRRGSCGIVFSDRSETFTAGPSHRIPAAAPFTVCCGQRPSGVPLTGPVFWHTLQMSALSAYEAITTEQTLPPGQNLRATG
jgi:hypothetical protein